MAQAYAGPNPYSKLESHRSNIRIALIIGIVAMVINLIFGFSLDTVFWAISIFQLNRWYSTSSKFTQNPSHDILKKLKNLRSTYIVLWILAAAMSALLWGLQPDSLLGIIVSAAATYMMGQFALDGEPLISGTSGRIPGEERKPTSGSFCGSCGAKMVATDKFCKTCGQKT